MRRRERKIRRVRIILFTTRGGTRSKSSRGQVRSPVFIFCLFYLARWDEWVPASRILKKNAEGEEKQRTVLEVQRRAKEEKEVKSKQEKEKVSERVGASVTSSRRDKESASGPSKDGNKASKKRTRDAAFFDTVSPISANWEAFDDSAFRVLRRKHI